MTSAQRNVGNLGLMPLNESYMPLGPRLHEEKFFITYATKLLSHNSFNIFNQLVYSLSISKIYINVVFKGIFFQKKFQWK